MSSEAFFPDPELALSAAGSPLAARDGGHLTTPIPKPRATRGKTAAQADIFADEQGDIYDPTEIINGIRQAVDTWRDLPESQWQVTPTTARLLRHWRSGEMPLPPFFCQIEAVETVIWLTEVAGKPEHKGRKAKLATAQR